MSEIKLLVTTQKGTYEIVRFKSYDIDLSIDIPADRFTVEIGNPTFEYSNLFDYGDRVKVIKGGQQILSGIIDDVDDDDDDGGVLLIDGRDTSLLLLDNDAVPTTLYNVDLNGLARHFATPYGLFGFDVEPGDKIGKLPITGGQIEWDVLNGEAFKQGKRVWTRPDDTIVVKKINYQQAPSYIFERGATVPGSVPIQSGKRRRSGANRRSEVWVRSYNGDSITHKAVDSTMKTRGLTRRRVLDVSDAKDQAETIKRANEALEQSKVGSWEYIAQLHGKHLIEIDKTARVRDDRYGIDEVLYIVGVNYKKDAQGGSRTTVRLRKLGEAV